MQQLNKTKVNMNKKEGKMDSKIGINKYKSLLENIKQEVLNAQYKAIYAVNKELMFMYWHIGKIILENSHWGNKFIDNLSMDLKLEFPEIKGFSVRNLKYMRKFAEEYPNFEFVQEVLAQITWYHNIILMRKRDGGKISFLRKRDGPLWINLKFFKDTEEYLDKQDAF